MDEGESGAYYKKRMPCGHCGQTASFVIRGSWNEQGWVLLECNTCDLPTLVQESNENHTDFESNPIALFPVVSNTPKPAADMPEDISKDYNEARKILPYSPRASAALLRLALQKLCIHLGQAGENLNHDIGELVKAGLSPKVQKAFDIVRVIGNNAVHPGQIDLNDNPQLTLALFRLINFLVEEMITRPREIDEIYRNLPRNQLESIKKRDQIHNNSIL